MGKPRNIVVSTFVVHVFLHSELPTGVESEVGSVSENEIGLLCLEADCLPEADDSSEISVVEFEDCEFLVSRKIWTVPVNDRVISVGHCALFD